jgi:UDP-glucose 4-epimerase
MVKSSKILVTGGTGYIGSHTVVELLKRNYEVVILDNLSNSSIEVISSIEEIAGKKPQFMKIDLCDKESVENFFKSNHVDAVVHFAALKSVGESVLNPLKYYQNNLVSIINLLEAIQRHKTNAFVFSSSCTVYGDPDQLPIDECAPMKKAESPYGNTKQISEEILKDLSKVSDLEVISLRYFNPIGAHESALIGEMPQGMPNNLVPVLTGVAIGKRDKFFVFGDDYNTPDGSCIRDYIHVVDIAKAHIFALERLLAGRNKSPFEVYNLGTGKGHSVFELIKTFEEITGIKLNYEVAPRRKGDVIKIFADTKLANQELGWRAEHSLKDMLFSAWKWEKHKENKKIAKL